MHDFIFDVITARGWSIRHLAEITGLSYSAIRDHLKGLPHRLSTERLARVYEILELDEKIGLKKNTLYTWRITLQAERLAALNRILVMAVTLHLKESPQSQPDSKRNLFEVTPFLSGDIPGLPAPYWLLHWREIYILILWSLPKAGQVTKVPNFYTQQDTGSNNLPLFNPNIAAIPSLSWAKGMILSTEKVCGITLTPAQLIQLRDFDSTEGLKLETIKDWLTIKPIEDSYWNVLKPKPTEWTWPLIMTMLEQRYRNPTEAAKALKLKK